MHTGLARVTVTYMDGTELKTHTYDETQVAQTRSDLVAKLMQLKAHHYKALKQNLNSFHKSCRIQYIITS